MAKRKAFHPGAIFQDQVGSLSLGEGEEQVMHKLSPKNNTFSFYEAGWRRPKTILGKKNSVEITREGRQVLAVQWKVENENFFSTGARTGIQKKREREMCKYTALHGSNALFHF